MLNIDIKDLPAFVEWARRNSVALFGLIALAFFGFAGWSFVGGYAAMFGQTVAGNQRQFRASVASYTIVDKMLHDRLSQYHASRIAVARFHNHMHDIGNNQLFYVLFESAVSAPGVTLDVGTEKDEPIATYSTIMPSLVKFIPVFLRTVDLPDNYLRSALQKTGVEVALFVPVRDLDDRLIGMIYIAWLNEVAAPASDDRGKILADVNNDAIKIGAYLTAKE